MRGLMQKTYRISDGQMFNDLMYYLALHPKAIKRKEQCRQYLVRLYGILDPDDFNAIWKDLKF